MTHFLGISAIFIGQQGETIRRKVDQRVTQVNGAAPVQGDLARSRTRNAEDGELVESGLAVNDGLIEGAREFGRRIRMGVDGNGKALSVILRGAFVIPAGQDDRPRRSDAEQLGFRLLLQGDGIDEDEPLFRAARAARQVGLDRLLVGLPDEEIDNGFFFFMELLMRYSQRLLWVSAILVLPLAVYAPSSLPSTVVIVSLAFAGRAGLIWFIAHHRMKIFRGMRMSDGYGSYGQACADWCSREKAVRPLFFGAVGVALAALYLLLVG